jgi:hypothetical protein
VLWSKTRLAFSLLLLAANFAIATSVMAAYAQDKSSVTVEADTSYPSKKSPYQSLANAS